MPDLAVNQFEAMLRDWRERALFDDEGHAQAERMRRAIAFVRGYRFESHAVGKTALDLAVALNKADTGNLGSLSLFVVDGEPVEGAIRPYSLGRAWTITPDSVSPALRPESEKHIKPGIGLGRDGRLFSFIGHNSLDMIPEGKGIATGHLLADSNGATWAIGIPPNEYLPTDENGPVGVIEESPGNIWIRLAMFTQANRIDFGY